MEIIGELGLNLLHEPSECLVDFIFVHGLRGGSRKTWSASSSPAHYWPKEWLPADPDFRHARIHSFGYNSDWLDRRENLLNIHDFGQSLMEEVQNSPSIRRTKGSQIVFIGHSMGGLVIKKACILAREDPVFHDIGARIHSIYFLATPHRGSDLAQTLDNILKTLPTGHKPFIGSLKRNSETINVLNDQFRHAVKSVTIHSFIESVPMNWGIGSGLVVDKESATLGYPDERIQTLNADHRQICKFDSPNDSNFRTLRNRLASTVKDIERCAPKTWHQEYRTKMQTISRYLGLTQSPVDDLSSVEETRIPGSCEWLTGKDAFVRWQLNEDEDSPRYLWLTGKPATGKSVLTAHVIRWLEDTNCSYYFFKHGDQNRSSISGLLRSIAYQMAQKNYIVRETILELSQDDVILDKDDYRSIWKKVFTGGILRTDFTSIQYWVIDALDECTTAEKRGLDTFFSLLAKIEPTVPIKIFMSSRFSVDLERLFVTVPFINIEISVEDTTADIRIFVQNFADDLPADDSETREHLVERIVQKSSGCFLWTVLVMQQLHDIYTLEEIEYILDVVPEEMDELYSRNLEVMTSRPRTKKLAQTILTWTICATRPLTVEELKDAIHLDLKTTVTRDLEKSISTLCGQFLFVDKYNRVQTIHETARIFLLNSNLNSEFRVHLPSGNLQLALACLTYLTSEDMSSTRKRRSSAVPIRESGRNLLASYACLSFSDHLARASSSSDALFLELTKFLRTNILMWIERMAANDNLTSLVRAAMHLKAYQARRAKHAAPLQDDVSAWALDLPRIVAEFGSNLLKYPAAIHDFIPPLCPKNSAIYLQFGASKTGLRLQGLDNTDWNDRIACWHYDSSTKCITCHDQWFAIGLSNGTIKIHLTSTCQEVFHMNHGEPVRIIRFGNLSKIVVSASLHIVKMWDLSTGLQLWEYNIDTLPLALELEDDDQRLLISTRSKEMHILLTTSGTLVARNHWYHTLPDDRHQVISRAPSAVSISASYSLMAIVYRSTPLCLWDLVSHQQLGFCIKTFDDGSDTSNNILSICFNPAQDLNSLAVAYMDGDIAVFDTISRNMKCHAKAETQLLAVSPNGRTLAGGDSVGNIKLFDFETLQLLYCVTPSSESIAALSFTSDSLRLMEVRGTKVNIWEPSVLVRKWDYADEDRSELSSDAPTLLVQDPSAMGPIDNTSDITTIATAFGGSVALCGRENGSVDVCDLNSDKPAFYELYKHKGTAIPVLSLDWNELHRIVASADASSRFKVMRLSKGLENDIIVVEELLDIQLSFGRLVNQLLISPDGTRFLVSSPSTDLLWSLEEKRLVASRETVARTSWRWFTHPQKPTQLVHFQNNMLQFFSWESSGSLLKVEEVGINAGQLEIFDFENGVVNTTNDTLVLKLSPQEKNESCSPVRSQRKTSLCTLDLQKASEQEGAFLRPIPFFSTQGLKNQPVVVTLLGAVIGAFRRWLLVFISTSGWICSVYLDDPAPHTSFCRHFFIPSAWLSTSTKILSLVTEKKDILFVRGHEVAIIKNGLESAEVISLY